jgi:TadE-like protein
LNLRRREGTRGQSLAEFALVVPIFLILLFSVFEFAFVFNALLSVGHATRDAALVAAEAGNSDAADCVTLRAIEGDIGAPADRSRIQTVLIYRSDANGNVNNSNTYTRTGATVEGSESTTCTLGDGSKLTVPYKGSAIGYKASTRCNVVAGCCKDGAGNVIPKTDATCPSGTTPLTLDTIGVRIFYRHKWITPLAGLGGNGGANLVQSTTMRMEPVL